MWEEISHLFQINLISTPEKCIKEVLLFIFFFESDKNQEFQSDYGLILCYPSIAQIKFIFKRLSIKTFLRFCQPQHMYW